MTLLLLLLFSSCLCCVLTGRFIPLARRYRLFDKPNQRSSHSQPTPRGGGLAIVASVFISCVLLQYYYPVFSDGFGWHTKVLLVCALLIAVISFVDDMRDLSVALRLSLQGLLSLILVFFVGPVPLANLLPIWASVMLSCIGLMWLLNLYNFMDGIDGLAASEAVVVCFAAAGVLVINNAGGSVIFLTIALAGSALGFLVWNWSPAKLFMGDSGSVFLGFSIGGLALITTQGELLTISVWLILLAVFIADASYTLSRRLFTGQDIFQAHRSHGYQILADHWASHAKVSLLYMGINIVWLVPLAIAANAWPQLSLVIVITAYVPLLAMMAKLDNLA